MARYCNFKRVLGLWAVVLALTIYSIYAPALKNGFVNWDDDVHLLQNPFIRDLGPKSLMDIFTTTVNTIYIPLTQLSFALEYHFFQEQAFIYHWTNIVLHVLVSLMLMFLALRLGLRLPAAFLAGLVFGIHPIHVESVAWVTERKDVLYAFFYMIALLVYVRYLQIFMESGKLSVFLLGVVFLAGLLSIFAKPIAVSLPFVLCVFDWYFKRPLGFRLVIEKLLLGFLLLPVAWITYIQQTHLAHWVFPQSFILGIWHYTFYLRGFFCPDQFFLFYKPPSAFDFANQELIIAGTILFLLFTAFWFKKWRVLHFAIFYYTASIFFLIPFEQANRLGNVSDRFMYLASAGFCVVIGAFADYLLSFKRNFVKIFFGAAIVLSVVFLAGKTIVQIQVWENSVSLWEHQQKSARMMLPALVYEKLGQAYLARSAGLGQSSDGALSDLAKSAVFFEKAIEINPNYSRAYRNLGLLCLQVDHYDCAQVNLEKALALDPKDFEAHFQRGRLFLKQGKSEQAHRAFEESLRQSPGNFSLRERIQNAMAGQISK